MSEQEETGSEESHAASEEEAYKVQDTVSSVLRQEREKLGLTQKDVADQLFLAVSFIAHLENAEYDKFPKKVFIKGYIRSYARILGLSGEDLVELYEAELRLTETNLADTQQEIVKKPEPDSSQNIVRAGIVALLLLLLLMLVLWFFTLGDDDRESRLAGDHLAEPPVLVDDQETVPPEESFPEGFQLESSDSPSSPVSQVREDESLVADEPVQEISVRQEDEESGSEGTEIRVEAESEAAINEADAEIKPLQQSEAERLAALKDLALARVMERDVEYIILRAGGEDELEFGFAEECWVEITDGDGALIYKSLNKQGDVLKVFGVPPFNILLGNGHAVTIKHQGQDVKFSSKVRNDLTARVIVGERESPE